MLTVKNLLHTKSNIGPLAKPIKYEMLSDNYKEIPEIKFLGEMDSSTDDLFRKSVDYSEKPPSKKEQAIMLWNSLLVKGPVIQYYNTRRYHESINNLTPEDVFLDRGNAILEKRNKIKLKTIVIRKCLHK